MRHAGLCLALVWFLVASAYAGTGAVVASPGAVTVSPADVPGILQSGGEWTNPYPSPSPRHRHAMTYDSQSDRIILFGGMSDGLDRETWAYSLSANTWRNMYPAISPSARFGHAMAYDSGSDRVILFGGNTTEVNGETWSYNFEANTWTNSTPTVSPPARFGHAMAYDSQSDRIVLFGGTTGAFSSETWSYDYNTNTWEQQNPATHPAAQSYHAMAYDSQSDRIVLFGGTTGVLSNETWDYDLNADTWTNLTTSNGPSARYRHAMAYDSQSDRIVLFGGYTGDFNGETWAYNFETNTWTKMAPAAKPSARSSHAMVYDSRSDRIVLFGGDLGASDDETWRYRFNADTWTMVSPPKPSRRYGHDMAYDAGSDRVVLFGGTTGVFTDDTWSYNLDANSWVKMVLPTRPSPRYRHAIAYDSESDRIILFGGYTGDFNGETWAYNFDANTWTNMNPAVGPSARSSHAMTYDSQSDRIILFGGTTETVNSETWAYDFETNTWTNMNPSNKPSARQGSAMVYDSESDRVILYGGNTDGGLSNETWGYDFETNAWTNRNPVAPPQARYRHAMVYDSKVDRTILFGGYTGNRSDATWSYDYATDTWTQMHPARHPPRRFEPAMAFDSGSGRSVMFGGDTGIREGETWWYQAPPSPPSAPGNFVVTPGDGQVLLSWQAPAADGGSPITGYKIYRGTASGSLTFLVQVGNVLTYSDTGLTNGVTYYYQVSGVSSAGEGPKSSEAAGTPVSTPSAPRNLNVAAGNGEALLEWQAPSSDGSSPITGYRIYRGTMPGGESFLAQVASVLTYTDTGLTNGVTYYYEVSAINAAGEGPVSNEASGRPENVASAPRALQATPGNAQVALAWQAPASDGGSPITGYKVYRGTASGSLSFLVQVGTVLTYTDTALTNGITYYYGVSAVNAAGEGLKSNEASATPATTPSAPRDLQAVSGDGRAILSWDAPSSDGGSPITGYKIYRGTSSGAEILLTTVGDVLAHRDSGLTNGVTYYYRVSAVNAAGEGPNSAEASATPTLLSDTTRPVIAIVSPSIGSTLGATSVQVSGTASDDVAVQKVELSTDGTTWVVAAGTTSWSGALTLTEGTNTIYARAMDTSGNTATVTVVVSVEIVVSGGGIAALPLVVVVLAVAAAAVAIALLLRRSSDRRKKGPGLIEERPPSP